MATCSTRVLRHRRDGSERFYLTERALGFTVSVGQLREELQVSVAYDVRTGQLLGQVLDNPRLRVPGYVRIYSARLGYQDRHETTVRVAHVA